MSFEDVSRRTRGQLWPPNAPRNLSKTGLSREILRNLLNFEKIHCAQCKYYERAERICAQWKGSDHFFVAAIPGGSTSQFIARKATGHLS